jgi:hypothetical protein
MGYSDDLKVALSNETGFQEVCQRVEKGLANALMINKKYTVPYIVPLMLGQRQLGVLAALIAVDTFLPAVFDFDPITSPFQVWCMQEDGHILYDEDRSHIGKVLFTDEMYQDFPELLKFGEQMQKEPWGMGYYSFFDQTGKKVIYKIASWDTLDLAGETTLKMVVSHPYVIEK